MTQGVRKLTAECTNFPAELGDAVLAHVVGNQEEAARRHGELFQKRRLVMDAWAEYWGNG